MSNQEQLAKKHEEALRVVEGLPEMLLECSGTVDVVAEVLIEGTEDAVASVPNVLKLLSRRLDQIYEYFDADNVLARLEQDEYRETYISKTKEPHTI